MDLTGSLTWTRQPRRFCLEADRVSITTDPHTDLWQRTYYHFRNDNAPLLQMETEERYFSFVVKTDFSESHHRFDQCGIVMYLDADNWLKASVEYDSPDGVSFTQMRVCHMWEGAGAIRFGVYACSPEDSSFTAVFTHFAVTECAWKAHDGQQPEE